MTVTPRRGALWTSICFVLAALAGAAFAQTGSPDLVERQFRAATDLERDGQVEPARQAYAQLLESDPSGPRAADALLALARLAWPLDNPAQLGKKPVDAKAIEDARARLEQVTQKFRGSAAAPEALWRLALLRLEPGAPGYDPEQALAAVTTLPVLYPDSSRVPDALALGAQMHLDAGRPARARALAFQALARWPDHPAAARAWLTLATADARDGRAEDALAQLGHARRVAAAAKDDAASQAALALATQLDRVAFASGRGARPFELDRSPGPAFTGRVRRLAIGPDGRIVAVNAGDDQLVTIPAGGGAADVRPMPGASAVAIDAWGRTWAASETKIQAPAGVPAIAVPERVEVVAIAPASPRALWVADGRGKRVVRLEAGAGMGAPARLPERANPVALVADGAGGAWVLDAKGGSLIDIGADGLPKRTVALANVAKDPVDLDRDALGNLYVLDADAPALLVFNRDGQLAIRQPFLPEGEQAITKPTALAVDRYGAVAVFDARRKRIQWLR